jgi:hypothetical protein
VATGAQVIRGKGIATAPRRARRNGITHRLVNIGALDQFLDHNDPNSVIEGRLHYRYARI